MNLWTMRLILPSLVCVCETIYQRLCPVLAYLKFRDVTVRLGEKSPPNTFRIDSNGNGKCSALLLKQQTNDLRLLIITHIQPVFLVHTNL